MVLLKKLLVFILYVDVTNILVFTQICLHRGSQYNEPFPQFPVPTLPHCTHSITLRLRIPGDCTCLHGEKMGTRFSYYQVDLTSF